MTSAETKSWLFSPSNKNPALTVCLNLRARSRKLLTNKSLQLVIQVAYALRTNFRPFGPKFIFRRQGTYKSKSRADAWAGLS
jgi:hypothetical protein